ncbi:glycoside hydrolase family 3 protein [Brachybacterium aquaticum]|uniref:beta-N-acetylhexosaminidase n=1 Tax=Brachybacterium aquaticum TaxID=1432564 RepID=A0A841AGR2_9MICO|nr:glycoside hydrolase family 3 protein [Brachybacterium aquaticum]MBB5832462.1 beta-N-acetylhexosaminidase [Brachybacterium aquaticum]
MTLTRRAFTAAALAGTGALATIPAAQAAPAKKGGGTKDRIEEILAGMSIEQKIGQLFVAVGYGSRADQAHASNTATTGVATIADIVRTHHVGGLIYFVWSENLQSIEQIATLSNDAQDAALESGGIPLVISADEERGVVYRLPAPATPLPGQMALGATGSKAHARKAGEVVGLEMRAAGLHQSFSPVADVNVEAQNPVIGVRSLGADAQAVAELVAMQIRGQQGANCSAAAKHFPGHGDTATDSHYGLPIIDHTREEIDTLDLPPFVAAIEEGVDAIMTAHIVVPALDDSGRPATLSHPILTGLLREELGYEGVIVTDSLAMEGVRTMFGDDRVPVEAILAGADQMLMPPDLVVAIGGVRDAVASGEITEERLDESVRRILAQKQRRGLFDQVHVDAAGAESTIGTAKSVKTARAIAEDSITVITAERGALPVRKGSRVLVTGVGTAAKIDAAVAELNALGFQATGLVGATAAQAATAAADHDAALVFTSSSGFVTPAAESAVVKAVAGTGTPVVHASLRNPYDVVHVGPVAASLAAYGNADASLRAIAGVLAGTVKARGTLPVPVPHADGTGEAYPIGHGLG